MGSTSDVAGRDEVMQMLGAARYAEWIHSQTGSHLMQFLMTVEKDKLYLAAGYKSFVEFLDGSGLKSKSTYYEHRKLFIAEGPEDYDLFEDLGVPARVRLLLTTGDYTVDGDEIVIGGDQRYGFGEGKVIKTAFERLIKDKIAVQGELVKSEKEISRLTAIENKYKELKAEVDEENDKPEYVIAYLTAVEAMLTFTSEIWDLPGEMKAARAHGDLDHMAELFRQLFDAYGESFLSWLADQKIKAKGAKA